VVVAVVEDCCCYCYCYFCRLIVVVVVAATLWLLLLLLFACSPIPPYAGFCWCCWPLVLVLLACSHCCLLVVEVVLVMVVGPVSSA